MLFKEGKITVSEQYLFEKEKWVKYINNKLEDIKNNNELLGVGKTAEAILTNNTACLKVVNKAQVRANRIPLTNNVNEEIEYLDMLNDTEFLIKMDITSRIAPIPILSTEKDGYGFLLMERVKGCSLQDILDKKDSTIKTSEVNWQEFFKKLENIVEKLNAMRVFHRDLHAGNIMIDEDHNPILIDFGSSSQSFYSEDDPYKEESVAGVIVYKKDTSFIQEIKKLFIN